MPAPNVVAVFAAFGRELGLADPLGEGTTAEITFDNDLTVLISIDADQLRIVLEADLGAWPIDDRLGRLLLKSNHVWAGQPVQFSLRPNDGNLVIYRCVDFRAISLDVLKAALTDLVHAAHAWQRLLRDSPQAKEPAVTADAVPPHSLRI